MDNDNLKPHEKQNRDKLRNEKPLVYDKIIKYEEKEKNGESTAIIDFCYDYICNMNCSHCCNLSFEKRDRELTMESLRDIANQADALGLAQFNISGGEPLFFKNLDEIVAAIGSDRFHIAMSTNGLLLDEKMAKHLKEIGVDKVKISLDSIDKEVYAQTRNQSKTYDQSIKALFLAKEAGLKVVVQTVISHQTCQTEATERLAKFCHENEFTMDVIIMRAIGELEGKEDVLITKEDAAYLLKLKETYPEVHRDVFPTYNETEGSCGCVDKVIHLTKYGDILPCVFIHISLGNIFDEPLKDIIDRGFKIKHFRDKTPLCLSGEDKDFIDKYMSKFYGKPLPITWQEAFTDEDFIK